MSVDAMLQEIVDFDRRHRVLREKFNYFHARCLELTAKAQPHTDRPLIPATVGALEPTGMFTVAFAGAELRIRFAYEPGGEHGAKGIVRCERMEVTTGKPIGLAPQFEYSLSGTTGVHFPGNGPLAQIDSAEGTVVLFAVLLRDGLMSAGNDGP